MEPLSNAGCGVFCRWWEAAGLSLGFPSSLHAWEQRLLGLRCEQTRIHDQIQPVESEGKCRIRLKRET
jgi:hypothetical protein